MCYLTSSPSPKKERKYEVSISVTICFAFQETGEAGWWKGELNGKEGVFPDNFAVQISELDKDFPVRKFPIAF